MSSGRFPRALECEGGYLSCEDCRERVALNSETLGEETVTCIHIINILAEVIPLKCRYTANGCRFCSNGVVLKIHETSCQFSESRCMLHRYGGCKWRGSKNQIKEHLDGKHKNFIIYNSEKSFTTCYRTTPARIPFTVAFYAHETLFKIVWGFDNPKKNLRLTAVILDNKSNEKFSFELTIFKKGTNEEAINLKSFCCNSNKLKPKLNGVLVVESKDIQTHCNEQGDLHFRVRISKIVFDRNPYL